MIKKLLFIVPFFFCSCASIDSLSISNGKFIDQGGRSVRVVGNPPMVCRYENLAKTFSGYFMYQQEDGTIVLDDFGRGTIYLMGHPICRLGLNE